MEDLCFGTALDVTGTSPKGVTYNIEDELLEYEYKCMCDPCLKRKGTGELDSLFDWKWNPQHNLHMRRTITCHC